MLSLSVRALVSFLCLPDLPDTVRVEEEPIDPIEFPTKD